VSGHGPEAIAELRRAVDALAADLAAVTSAHAETRAAFDKLIGALAAESADALAAAEREAAEAAIARELALPELEAHEARPAPDLTSAGEVG
jgi:hypothetical protein